MQYQTSASSKLPGPSSPVPSRRNSARNRSATSVICFADERTVASAAGSDAYAMASQPPSSLERNPAESAGGPHGAVIASDTTASITSA